MQTTVNSAARRISPAHAPNLLAAMIAAVFLLSFVLVQPLAAQGNAPAEFSDKELQAFAAATLEVEKVQAKWQPQLAEAKTAEETDTLRRQAVEEMADAVRGEGLSVDQYNGIHAAAQQDPELRDTVIQYRENLQ